MTFIAVDTKDQLMRGRPPLMCVLTNSYYDPPHRGWRPESWYSGVWYFELVFDPRGMLLQSCVLRDITLISGSLLQTYVGIRSILLP